MRGILWRDWAANWKPGVGLFLWSIGAALLSRADLGDPLGPLFVMVSGIGFIALLYYFPWKTILEERTAKTVAFTMSLPLRPRDYAVAKLLSNLSIFLPAWTGILLIELLTIPAAPARPNEFHIVFGIPSINVLFGMLAVQLVIVGAALGTNSEAAFSAAGIGAWGVLMIGSNGLYPGVRYPAHVIVSWPILAAEALAIAAIVALILALHARKTSLV
jgi:hypothetical protein